MKYRSILLLLHDLIIAIIHLCQAGIVLLIFHFNTKDFCIQRPKSQLSAKWLKGGILAAKLPLLYLPKTSLMMAQTTRQKTLQHCSCISKHISCTIEYDKIVYAFQTSLNMTEFVVILFMQ